MSDGSPLWITERDVVGLLHLGEAIDALEAGLRQQASGHALNLSKTHVTWGEGDTLHAIGGVFAGLGWFGAKAWGHTHGGATPLFLLWRADGGGLAAVIEAFALGQMRTGGISGVATRWASDPAADVLGIIGSGKQALTQVAAVGLVRPLREVRVFSPTQANREDFAARLAGLGFGFRVRAVGSVREAIGGSAIVTTVTRSREVLLAADELAVGAHVNAVGAITPERREIGSDLLARAGLVSVDDPAAAQALAAELIDAEKADILSWGSVRPLASLIDQPRASRPPGRDLSIFKAMGMGLSDLSLAVEIHERARARKVGRAFDQPIRVPPRLRPDEGGLKR